MAAVNLVEVSTAQLNSDIRRLRAALEQTRKHVELLRTKMDAMNGMWEGPANAAMRQRFQADYQQMQALCASIEELIQVLEAIRRSYDRCEDEVRSAVDALRI
ncbi:MAG: hypothetical protein HFF90_01840 [Oscillibacter sp.]|nr:hypothetical protein [Oscillibacter sp.]